MRGQANGIMLIGHRFDTVKSGLALWNRSHGTQPIQPERVRNAGDRPDTFLSEQTAEPVTPHPT